MNDFRTIEGATAIFQQLNALDQQNNIFVLLYDTQHESTKYGIAGGLAGGLAAGIGIGVGVVSTPSPSQQILNGDYKGLLVNETERGLHLVALQGTGGMLMVVKADRLEAHPEQYVFLDYSQIRSIEVKNFSFIKKSVQKVRIGYGDKAKMFLLGNVNEANIPYHAENFAKFCAKYKK